MRPSGAVLDRRAGSGARDAYNRPSPAAAAVDSLLSLPDDQLDYAYAKVTLDTLVDPATDVSAVMLELDHWVEQARLVAGPVAAGGEMLGALRTLIYEPGPWNDHRPFAYDHSDPLGQSLPGRLLANYLATRRGNCVSMPILFLILADRLGLNMALATAPLHVFCRYTDASGRVVNLETTSGAHPTRDEWFRQKMPMTDRAIANGIYMRTLSRRESVALMAHAVVEHLIADRRHAEAVEVAAIILRRNPRDAYAMVKQGTAYAHMIDAEFVNKYPMPFLIPAYLRPRYDLLDGKNQSLFEAAKALGWEPVD